MHARHSIHALTLAFTVAAAVQAQQSPNLVNITPVQDSTVTELSFITVIFDESVVGVDASDLLINGTPATRVATNNPNDYAFYFPQPPTGAVQVAWAINHGITAPLGQPFAGGSWTYTLDTNALPAPRVIISEFMADNAHGIQDDNGTRSDWIEVLNSGPIEANLSGWFLTDERTNLTKWQFPAGLPLLSPNQYLLIWAQPPGTTDPAAPLHTNFKLAKEAGNYLALVDPRTNIASAFDPYPLQQADVSYGRDRVDPSIVGYLTTPTPRAQNTTTGSAFAADPVFSVASGIYTNDSLTLTISAAAGTIRYTRDGTVPTGTSPVYTGPITFTNNSTFKARVFQSGVFPSQVVVRNFIFLDGSSRDFNSNIPLMIISTEGRAIAQNVPPGAARTKGSLTVIDTFRGRTSLRATPDFQGMAELELYGQTSAGFPKPAVRIEVQDELGNDLKVPLLGLPPGADWKTRNPFDDKTLLNDFLGYELFEKMGHYSCRRRFVEVFVDSGGGRLSYPGDYVGVEVLFETLKQGKDRVDIADLTPYATNEPAISGGWIFKKDKDSQGDINFNTAGGNGFPSEALKIHQPSPNSLRTTVGQTTAWPGPGYTPSGSNQLRYLVGYLNQMEKALYATNWLSLTGTNHYSSYLDVDSFVDFHWLVEFTKQIDGIRLSSYFTKDRNGKVIAGPVWDWNLSFGNANYLRGGTTNVWYYEEQDQGITANEHIWLRRLINGAPTLAVGVPGPGGDPDFNQKIADRWGVLRTNVFGLSNTLARIDELSTMLSDAAARDLWGKWRSQIVGVYQWPNPDGSTGWDVDFVHPTNYLGNNSSSIIWQMKKWMTGRYLWIDNQFTPMPTMSAPDAMVTNGSKVTLSVPPGATVYYTLDGTDPRGLGGVTNGSVYTGPITVTGNVRIVARARRSGSWYNTWSSPAAATFYTGTPALRITEIMYHPAPPPPGSTNSAEDFEYIEVKNIGGSPLNVNRFNLSGGVQFQFPNVVLAAGESAVVVANVVAFQSRYPSYPGQILGAYTGRLNNAGDHLVLKGAVLEPILDFSYNNNWFPVTDGLGFSLTLLDENAPLENWGLASSWRASSAVNGSPGQNDPPPPPRPTVLVNEALSHSVPPAVDLVELYNPTASPVNLGGWFLSDAFGTPMKFMIPATNIPAGGYVVFSEADFNNTNSPNVLKAFALSSAGDDIWLFSGDGVNLTGYAHGYHFGAAPGGVSFGRHVTSVGEDHFVAQVSDSLGAANAGPKVGPVVISEILYNPFDVVIGTNAWNNTEDEFIELQNTSNQVVPLYDPNYPTNHWRLRDAVDFEFPPNVTLPAQGYLLVVSFDPANSGALADFRARNNVPDNVPVYGPFAGQLDNAEDRVELVRPDAPEAPPSPNAGSVSYILVERVHYLNRAPWPVNTNSIGVSLQRLNPAAYGDDPINWTLGGRTPGAPYPGGQPPVVSVQPTNQTVVATYGQARFTVGAIGTAPLSYQWRHNGMNINGATSPTLLLSNVDPPQGGDYQAVVLNPAGYVISSNATLYVQLTASLLVQPTNILVRIAPDPAAASKTNVTFLVSASSTNPPIFYQWHKNGVPIPGATSTSLTISNVQIPDAGNYVAAVRDGIGTAFTTNAALYPLVTPVWETNWVYNGTNRIVVTNTLTVASNCWVTFGARLAAGYPPPFTYEWRRGSTVFATTVSSDPYQFLTFLSPGNIASNQLHRLVVKNLANSTPGIPLVFNITTLMDSDGDGLPDLYESNYGFNTNSADAQLDADGDGMSNWAEYIAGTDPTNALSYLKVDLSGVSNAASLSFIAVSNRTYTVQVNDNLGNGPWSRLADFLATPTNRVESVVDPVSLTNRVYRLVTPWQP